MFKGDKDKFSAADLDQMEKRKTLSHIRTPDEVSDNLEQKNGESTGLKLYNTYCRACHQSDGNGDDNHFPPLAGSEWVKGDKERLIKIVLNGLNGPVTVKGKTFNGMMPKNDLLSDDQVADILTYVRQSFGNTAGVVNPEDIKKLRKPDKAKQKKLSK